MRELEKATERVWEGKDKDFFRRQNIVIKGQKTDRRTVTKIKGPIHEV